MNRLLLFISAIAPVDEEYSIGMFSFLKKLSYTIASVESVESPPWDSIAYCRSNNVLNRCLLFNWLKLSMSALFNMSVTDGSAPFVCLSCISITLTESDVFPAVEVLGSLIFHLIPILFKVICLPIRVTSVVPCAIIKKDGIIAPVIAMRASVWSVSLYFSSLEFAKRNLPAVLSNPGLKARCRSLRPPRDLLRRLPRRIAVLLKDILGIPILRLALKALDIYHSTRLLP